jgi:16S rRNA G966 N2-methylase RsmD
MLLNDVKLTELLEPSGIFVLEKRPEQEMPPTPLWEITRARRYGATEVLFLQHIE